MDVKAVLRLRWVQALIVLVVWAVTATALKGIQTQELSTATNSPFTAIMRDLAASIRGNRTESFLFVYVFNPLRAVISGFIEFFMGIIAVPASGNLIPLLGWFGTLAVIGFIVYATSTLRMAFVSMFLMLLCGMLGMWLLTMETLAMTIGAVVLSLLIALPLGVWAGLNDKVMKVLRPWLDLAQVLPTLVYLAPLALGLAVVLLAVMLDRSTSAAVNRDQSGYAAADAAKVRRRIGLAIFGVLTLIAIYLSRYLLWFAVFPEQLVFGERVAEAANAVSDWITDNLGFLTVTGSEQFTIWVLNPLQDVLANSPWWLTLIAITLLAFILAGRTVGILVFVLLALVMATGLWNDTMLTLAMTLIATGFVVIIGIVLGVWAGRSARADRFLRPFLDAGQTMPAFVYLVPVLALFGPTRFAAIVLGVVYAAPVVIRIVADGIRQVPKESVEAAVSAGSTTLQVITKVQLPVSRRSILLGVNQGLIFVLAVVVIGGFVGAGGLGYLVIVGQSKPELAGKGLAAGIAIVLLGIILDRIAQGRPQKSPQGRH